eukprot:c5632_g1_i1.p1 GENE.c5632_g1_i1~~c5632_g1_i1.p1  ORF type:complete len:313 (-),score=59.43 c5632_g1_i1:68-961(-)
MSKPEPGCKSYLNHEFLQSRSARVLRIICEFEEPLHRLRAQNVKETIMIFGSARAKSRELWQNDMDAALERLKTASDEDRPKIELDIEKLKKTEWICDNVDSTIELSRRLTEWAMDTYRSSKSVGAGHLSTTGEQKQSLMICTGGGPGLMQAANQGAAMVPGAKNIGMKITLPFEKNPNLYVTPELLFEFNYFFTRKFWMLYPCRALVVCPGGFGTMDELFELLALKQAKKIKMDIPIVLFGTKYWRDVLKLEAAVKYGTVSRRAYESLLYTDDVNEAFEFLTTRIVALRDAEEAQL